MTWILVLLCLAIAGRETYMAFDRRLPRLQLKVDTLRDRMGRLSTEVDGLKDALPSGPADKPALEAPHDGPAGTSAQVSPAGPSATPPPGDGPLTDRPPTDQLVAGRVPRPEERHAAGGDVDGLRQHVERLDRELAEANDRLAELEREREAQRALARSLDSVEEVVGELRRDMLDRLDSEDDTVRGLVMGEDPSDEAPLSSAYEQVADEHGLRVRVRESTMGRPWYTGYYFSGRRTDEVAKELLTLARALRGQHDTSALSALLVGFADMASGVARIGAFTIVRTPQSLNCGILPDYELGDTDALTTRIRELPAVFRCDLTWLYTTD